MLPPLRKRCFPEQEEGLARPLKKHQSCCSGAARPKPEFWDNLSTIFLTKRALRELDRRNKKSLRAPRFPSSQRRITRSIVHEWNRRERYSRPSKTDSQILNSSPLEYLRDIQAFARHGGPDLSELTGYEPLVHPLDIHMSSRGNRNSRTSRASELSCDSPVPTASSSKKSHTSTYDRNFLQNLIDHGVYPHEYEHFPGGQSPPPPENMAEIRARSAQKRPSLSPSRFTDSQFKDFMRADAHAAKEALVMKNVIPTIEGRHRSTSGSIKFINLEPLTDGSLAPGNPDVYYGAAPKQLDRRIRDELSKQIIPTTQHELPIAPNFVLAAKGPNGTLAVAQRQVIYDGALAARGMHSLRAYGQDQQPSFDNKAYAFSSSYHGGLLKMYTSHPGPPVPPSTQPEYYSTQIAAFALTNNRDSCAEGVSAYRNLRDLAKEYRDEAIAQANARLSESLLNDHGDATESVVDVRHDVADEPIDSEQQYDVEHSDEESDEYMSAHELPNKRVVRSTEDAQRKKR